MKKYFYLMFILIISILVILPKNIVFAAETTTQIDLNSYFSKEKGCAVFFHDDKKEYKVYNNEFISKRAAPCSTFKIMMILAGLKYGILKDENTLIKWDGEKRTFNSWNQDLTLKDAFRFSAIWCFEKVAEMIGQEKLDEFVKNINYGNCDISAGGRFWIDSSLKISPKEQVEFLRRLFNGELDVKSLHIEILKQIMCNEENKTGDGYIFGKTGTSFNGNNGWFVGKYKSTYFAIRLFKGENVTGNHAREIFKNLLIDGVN